MSPRNNEQSEPMNNEEFVEEVLDESAETQDDDNRTSGTPGWFISVGTHILFGLICYFMVWSTLEEETELPPMKVTTIDPPPKKEEKKELERQLENTVEINVQSEADVAAPINNLDVPLEESSRSTPTAADRRPPVCCLHLSTPHAADRHC